MADLNDKESSGTVKITGADNTGTETNFLAVDSDGQPTVKLADSDGDLLTSTLNAGKQALDVNIVNSLTTTSGAPDQDPFTYGTSSQQTIGGVYQDSGASLTAGEMGAARVTQNRALHTNLRDASGNESATSGNPLRVDPTGTTAQPVTDNGGSLTVDGTIAATQSGTWNINNVSGTVSLPTGASTLAEQQTQTTSLQTLDNIVSTPNSAPNSGVPLMGQMDDTATVVATEGNVSIARITAQRALHNNLRDSSGNEILSAIGLPALADRGLVVRSVPYEPATFTAVSPNTATALNKSMISIANTGTSVVKIKKIYLVNNRTAAATGVACEFRFHRFTTQTGGTAITPTQHDTNDSLPAGVSATTGATISGEAGLLRTYTWSTDEWGPGTLDVEASDHGFQNIPFWETMDNTKGITIRQNQGAHIRCATNTTTGLFDIIVVFTTES